jgi:8-oxo-dGTP diphosphatase
MSKTITCLICEGQEVEEVVHENRRYYYCHSCHKLHERAFDSRYGKDILIVTPEGPMHFSVGALIRNRDKILLIKRRSYPYGYSFPAGHIEYNEVPLKAVQREVLEEIGLKLSQIELLFHGVIKDNKCRYGVNIHMWHFYTAIVDDDTPIINSEIESVTWQTIADASNLDLVPVARYLLKHVIQNQAYETIISTNTSA